MATTRKLQERGDWLGFLANAITVADWGWKGLVWTGLAGSAAVSAIAAPIAVLNAPGRLILAGIGFAVGLFVRAGIAVLRGTREHAAQGVPALRGHIAHLDKQLSEARRAIIRAESWLEGDPTSQAAQRAGITVSPTPIETRMQRALEELRAFKQSATPRE